jgi:uncharacterized protein
MSKIGCGRLLLSIAALVALRACTVLPAQPDASRFFLLTPTTDTVALPEGVTGHELSLGLGPVSFPDYLNRRELVTRVNSDQLVLSDINRWAEPLDANFRNVLAQDLASTLGTRRITIFPWYGSPQIDYQVEIQVHRFETGPGGRSQLDASWFIKDGHSDLELFAGQTTSGSPVSGGDAGDPAALSEDVGVLARAIAERIVILERHRQEQVGADKRMSGIIPAPAQ